jgi:hypothetical protein
MNACRPLRRDEAERGEARPGVRLRALASVTYEVFQIRRKAR